MKEEDKYSKEFDFSTPSTVIDWIQQIVPGKTFADLGGLWSTVNERVSVAALAGASEYTMMDNIRPENSNLWQAFDDRMAEFGVADVKKKVINVMDFEAVKTVNPVDVLHCNGVIYHMPDFFKFMFNISKLTREYLILGSAVVPNEIKSAAGTLLLPASGLLPQIGLSYVQREIIKQYFSERELTLVGLNDNGRHSYYNLQDENLFYNTAVTFAPWWWFFTPKYLYNLLIDFGYEIIDHKNIWIKGGYAFLCKKNKTLKIKH